MDASCSDNLHLALSYFFFGLLFSFSPFVVEFLAYSVFPFSFTKTLESVRLEN